MTRGRAARARAMAAALALAPARALVLAAGLFAAGGAAAHGEVSAPPPWLAGSRAFFDEPAGGMLVLGLALLLAFPEVRRLGAMAVAGVAGLILGALGSIAGWVSDPTLALLAGALALGGLTAVGRPVPSGVLALLTLAATAALVTLLAPAPTAGLGDRLAWLAGVFLTVALVLGNGVGALRALMGRRPGPVRRLLLRVAGSWVAAAALLVGVLEIGRRGGWA